MLCYKHIRHSRHKEYFARIISNDGMSATIQKRTLSQQYMYLNKFIHSLDIVEMSS